MPTVVLTGFGVFANVTRNPTEDIVNSLLDWHPDDFTLRTEVLVCSVDSVEAFFSNLGEGGAHENPRDDIILVHLGVDQGSNAIKLESTAYNNMTFRVPDQNSYQPQESSIVSECVFDAPLTSLLDTKKLCKQLEAEEWTVETSEDPGRFLCNYVYYRSLCFGSKRLSMESTGQCQSLFIHVPAVEVVSLKNQVIFVKRAIEEIVHSCKQI